MSTLKKTSMLSVTLLLASSQSGFAIVTGALAGRMVNRHIRENERRRRER